MVLSNVSRSQTLAQQIFGEIEKRIPDLVKAFTRTDYNKKKCHLNYLGKCRLNFKYFWICVAILCRSINSRINILQDRYSVIYLKRQKVGSSFVMEMRKFYVVCCHLYNLKEVLCEREELLVFWKTFASILADTLIYWKKLRFFQLFYYH